jgi:hypothetical protein
MKHQSHPVIMNLISLLSPNITHRLQIQVEVFLNLIMGEIQDLLLSLLKLYKDSSVIQPHSQLEHSIGVITGRDLTLAGSVM